VHLKKILPKRIFIKGVPFDRVTHVEARDLILDFLGKDKQLFVTTPNPEFLVETTKTPKFKKVLGKADLSVADGIGILWASTFLSKIPLERDTGGVFAALIRLWQAFYTLLQTLFVPQKIRKILPERVCGSDLFLDLCEKSSSKIFLLGAAPGVAEQTKAVLKKKFPNVKIVGTHAGTPQEKDEKVINNMINDSGTELLFVAYGSPRQEMWIDRNLSKMPSVKVAMGIGGSFDFVAGVQKRAPGIFRKLGLEWLWRLIREPKRFKRIWNATGVFVGMIIRK